MQLDDLDRYLDLAEAAACARRIITAWETGDQPAGVLAWGLAAAADQAERATAGRSGWCDDNL